MIGDIRRVTAGAGGEALLIIGSEKSALIDCGMAYCGPEMAKRAAKELAGRPLDYALLTHTHYDHLGGLPYLRELWPRLEALGAAHGVAVLQRPGAVQMIRRLSGQAALEYGKGEVKPFPENALRIDRVIGEGERISLGDRQILVLECPGHTNDSLSFFLTEDSVIFPCESIGCYLGGGRMDSPVLTSFADTLASIEKCERLEAKHIISPHYGVLKGEAAEHYWEMARNSVLEVRDYILKLHGEGKNHQEIFEACQKRFWRETQAREQPLMAFTINMKHTIDVAIREFASEQ